MDKQAQQFLNAALNKCWQEAKVLQAPSAKKLSFCAFSKDRLEALALLGNQLNSFFIGYLMAGDMPKIDTNIKFEQNKCANGWSISIKGKYEAN